MAVKENNRWAIYTDVDGNFGPHQCESAKEPVKFLRMVGWGKCRGCGAIVKWVERGLKRFPLSGMGKKHNCTERLLPPEDRHWSGDGSYSWEYPIVNGKAVLLHKWDKFKGRPAKYTEVKSKDWVFKPEDNRLLDEALRNMGLIT